MVRADEGDRRRKLLLVAAGALATLSKKQSGHRRAAADALKHTRTYMNAHNIHRAESGWYALRMSNENVGFGEKKCEFVVCFAGLIA